MCKKSNTLLSIKSKNELYEVKVSKPVNDRINLFCNFSIFAYMKFVDVLSQLSYVDLNHIKDYEDGTSGMCLVLKEDNCLSQLVEDIPELIFQYVEMAEPKETVHCGKGGGNGDN